MVQTLVTHYARVSLRYFILKNNLEFGHQDRAISRVDFAPRWVIKSKGLAYFIVEWIDSGIRADNALPDG
jgi:hypothetical protein